MSERSISTILTVVDGDVGAWLCAGAMAHSKTIIRMRAAFIWLNFAGDGPLPKESALPQIEEKREAHPAVREGHRRTGKNRYRSGSVPAMRPDPGHASAGRAAALSRFRCGFGKPCWWRAGPAWEAAGSAIARHAETNGSPA